MNGSYLASPVAALLLRGFGIAETHSLPIRWHLHVTVSYGRGLQSETSLRAPIKRRLVSDIAECSLGGETRSPFHSRTVTRGRRIRLSPVSRSDPTKTGMDTRERSGNTFHRCSVPLPQGHISSSKTNMLDRLSSSAASCVYRPLRAIRRCSYRSLLRFPSSR